MSAGTLGVVPEPFSCPRLVPVGERLGALSDGTPVDLQCLELWPGEVLARVVALPSVAPVPRDARSAAAPPVLTGVSLTITVDPGGEVRSESASAGGGRYAGWRVEHSFLVAEPLGPTTTVTARDRDGAVLGSLVVPLDGP